MKLEDVLGKKSLAQCYGGEEMGLVILDEKMSTFWTAPTGNKAKRKFVRPGWVLEIAKKAGVKIPNVIIIDAIDSLFMQQPALVTLLNKALNGIKLTTKVEQPKSKLDDLPPLTKEDLEDIEEHAKSLGVDKKTLQKAERARKKVKEAERAAQMTEAVSSASTEDIPDFKSKREACDYLRKTKGLTWKKAIEAIEKGEVTVGRGGRTVPETEEGEESKAEEAETPTPPKEVKQIKLPKPQVVTPPVIAKPAPIVSKPIVKETLKEPLPEGSVRALGKTFATKSEAYKWLREDQGMSWKQAIATVAAEAGGGATASLVSIADL